MNAQPHMDYETFSRWIYDSLARFEQEKNSRYKKDELYKHYQTSRLELSNEALTNPEAFILDFFDYRKHRQSNKDANTHTSPSGAKGTNNTSPSGSGASTGPDQHAPGAEPGVITNIEEEPPVAQTRSTTQPTQVQESITDAKFREYFTMSDQELLEHGKIPPGDIDQNAQRAAQELDIDVDALFKEIEARTDQTRQQTDDQGHDLER